MANLDQLKAKYQKAIDLGMERGLSWKNVHIEGEKLLIRGAAPDQAVKNDVWTAIKAIDPAYADLTADITIDPTLPRLYRVVSGDTLSKIAKQFYGDASKYPRIFEANRDQLSDPDKIKVGQLLKVPV